MSEREIRKRWMPILDGICPNIVSDRCDLLLELDMAQRQKRKSKCAGAVRVYNVSLPFTTHFPLSPIPALAVPPLPPPV